MTFKPGKEIDVLVYLKQENRIGFLWRKVAKMYSFYLCECECEYEKKKILKLYIKMKKKM